MTDTEKFPDNRNLEPVEDGFDDNLDVPTYRKLASKPKAEPAVKQEAAADAPPADTAADAAPAAAPETELTATFDAARDAVPEASTSASTSDMPDAETTVTPRPSYDAYAAAGRTKPQVIKPKSASAHEDAHTQVIPRVERGIREEDQPTQVYAGADSEVLGSEVHGSEAYSDSYAEPYSEKAVAGDAYDYNDNDFRTEMMSGVAGTGRGAGAGAAAATAATSASAAHSSGHYSDDPDFVDSKARAYDRDDEYAVDDRRGTTGFGLLILRLGIGALLLIQGLTTLFGWGNSGGISALEADFAHSGFKVASVLGTAIPTVQLIAGGLLILGLATPLGAALALALSAYLSMFEVATSSTEWNIFGPNAAGIQLQILLTAVALGIQFTGPGRIGVDFGRGWARRPLASSWIFCILGVVAAVVLWYFTSGTWPFVGSKTGV